MFVSLSKAWRWAHNFLYYLWQVRVNACTTVHVQRGPGEPVTCPLLQFLHSILPRYNYSTSLPTCSSPCRSVRRPPAPRHPHMQIRRLPPPSHTDSAGLSCRVSEGRGLGPSPPPSAPTTSENAPSASVRWLCPRSALHPGPKACSTNELMDFQFFHSRWSVSVTVGQCFCVVFVFYTCRSECRPGTSAAV